MPTPRILLADDQPDVLTALRLLLKNEGLQTETATSPAGILNAIEASDFDALLMDLNYTRDTTSGKEGLDLLTRIQSIDPTLPVIVMTAWGTVEVAVEAMRRGARDFIQKPWENARLLAILRNQIELAQALRNRRLLEAENAILRGDNLPKLIAEAPAMKPVLDLITRVGPSDANVMITGEHGTGKEVVAQTIHAVSSRAPKTMVSVNVGGLAEGVFESEMFGHIRGSFTGANTDRVGRFELADQGTLFLDEIANITMNQQARLLRVLETGEVEKVGSSKSRQVNVRVITATNAQLHEDVAAGRFREDLLFRLNTVEIHLPALRERREDIPLLANHFLQKYAQRYARPVAGFEPQAMQLMLDHPWPGNVREVDHVVQRAVLMSQSTLVKPPDLGLQNSRDAVPKIDEMSLEDVERYLIKKTLARSNGNVTEAAKTLGLSRSAMYRRLQKHGL